MCKINTREILHHRGSLWPLQRQRAVACRLIGQRHVVHDNVFVEPLDQPLANHRVRNAEEPVHERIRLDLRENVALRIQQQRNGAAACGQVLDVVRQNRVQVAHPVGPSEGEMRAVVLVDQRHRLPRIVKLGGRVAKVIRQGAAEPNAHLRARGKVHRRKRSVQSCSCSSHFKALAHPPGS